MAQVAFCGLDDLTDIAYLSLREAQLELAAVMDGRVELHEQDGWTWFTVALPADRPAAKNVKTAQALS